MQLCIWYRPEITFDSIIQTITLFSISMQIMHIHVLYSIRYHSAWVAYISYQATYAVSILSAWWWGLILKFLVALYVSILVENSGISSFVFLQHCYQCQIVLASDCDIYVIKSISLPQRRIPRPNVKIIIENSFSAFLNRHLLVLVTEYCSL